LDFSQKITSLVQIIMDLMGYYYCSCSNKRKYLKWKIGTEGGRSPGANHHRPLYTRSTCEERGWRSPGLQLSVYAHATAKRERRRRRLARPSHLPLSSSALPPRYEQSNHLPPSNRRSVSTPVAFLYICFLRFAPLLSSLFIFFLLPPAPPAAAAAAGRIQDSARGGRAAVGAMGGEYIHVKLWRI
jgi:hypothetical protein